MILISNNFLVLGRAAGFIAGTNIRHSMMRLAVNGIQNESNRMCHKTKFPPNRRQKRKRHPTKLLQRLRRTTRSLRLVDGGIQHKVEFPCYLLTPETLKARYGSMTPSMRSQKLVTSE